MEPNPNTLEIIILEKSQKRFRIVSKLDVLKYNLSWKK